MQGFLHRTFDAKSDAGLPRDRPEWRYKRWRGQARLPWRVAASPYSRSNSSRAVIMSIDQTDAIDFATIDKASGDLWLTISDHLSWEENEGNHLILLQSKLNAYLRFIESGEVFKKVPDAKGRGIVINLVGKFPLSQKADLFFGKARAAVEGAGFRLEFSLVRPNFLQCAGVPKRHLLR